MRTEFARLLKLIRRKNGDEEVQFIRKAYRVANKAHQGQVRLSGDPYVSHSLAVARNLAKLDLDCVTVAAGLLHDVLEDTSVTHEELEREFGTELAQLVDGVTKISSLHFPQANPSDVEKQAVNLRKMLVATAQDVRVILIKLADRLHNMRTIEHLPARRIEHIARETLEIYAPLAHRLGIEQWKWELEDHAFHQLHPHEYRELARRVAMKRRQREAWLKETINFLEQRLNEAEVVARVIGRPKHLYSIYQKMVQQGKTFDQVMDIQAVRIICETVSGCYNALGIIHQIWPPVPGRFKDYIAMPKANMYQSIHTTVMRENGLPMEVQIRTEEMDRIAREGIAAHWRYKESRVDTKLDTELRWLRQMYEWLQDADAPQELIEGVRRDVGRSDIYVFTPKGEVKELPNGATPLDFAYMIHSDVGHQAIGVRVNGRMVPLRYHLQTGDVVEILTSRNQTPHVDWLDIVVTGKARTRIRQKLRELGELEPLDRQLRKDVVQVLPAGKPVERIRDVDDKTREKLIRIDGHKGIQVQFAKCCKPMPGHPVIAYAVKGGGITVHRADCASFVKGTRDPNRIIAAAWEGDQTLVCAMRVVTGQRPNVLADITHAIRPLNVNITKAEYKPVDTGNSYFEFVFEAPDEESVDRVVDSIRVVAGVSDVNRISTRLAAASNS